VLPGNNFEKKESTDGKTPLHSKFLEEETTRKTKEKGGSTLGSPRRTKGITEAESTTLESSEAVGGVYSARGRQLLRQANTCQNFLRGGRHKCTVGE